MMETAARKDNEPSPSADEALYLNKDQRYFGHARPEMVDILPSSAATILDIGCSCGQFGKLAKDTRSQITEVWGIELHRDSALRAESALDHVVVGGVPEAFEKVPDRYFDCLTFNDVLEHIADPEAVLTAAKAKLKPGGYIVTSIPNIREFNTLWNLVFRKQWEYTDSGILDRTHVRFFTQSSIRNMFQRLGYEVEYLQGINRNWRRWPRLFNLLTLGCMSDTLYLQFACRAKLRD